MAQQWGILIAVVALAITVMLVLARLRDGGRGRAVGIAAGVMCGLVAGFVILQPRMDVLPDAVETLVAAVVIVLVSLALIMLTWRRGMQD